jgi:arsenate reductase
MSVALYGIPNCDQVKKARNWLSEHGIDVHFHDFKKAGISPELVRPWLTQVDWNSLINRKGSTWRNLPEHEQVLVQDELSAIHCMVHHPSVIKRPVLVVQDKKRTEIFVGFSEENYHRLFDAE